MTSYLDEEEYNRWMKNAQTTLRSAINDKSSQFYNWACFKAQQAAEYAVKAYLRGIGKGYSEGQKGKLSRNKHWDKRGAVNKVKYAIFYRDAQRIPQYD